MSSLLPWPIAQTLPRRRPSDDSLVQDVFQTFVFVGVGVVSRLWLYQLNDLEIHGAEYLQDLLTKRTLRKAPVITVTNHNSTIDDPALLSVLAPFRVLAHPDRCCWSWCAKEICFANPVYSSFFHNVKTIPIIRGNGVRQPAVGRMISYGLNGSWIHVFPEGKVIQAAAGERLQIRPLRWGVGRLITEISRIREPDFDLRECPVVIPFVHQGMQDVLPLKTHVPRMNKKVRVLFGDPIQYDDLITEHIKVNSHRLDWNDPMRKVDEELYAKITKRIENELRRLMQQLNQMIGAEERKPSV